MKKSLLTICMVGLSVAAFAQGKVAIDNLNNPVTFTTDTKSLKAADVSLAGLAVPNASASTPSGSIIYLGLYASTTSGTIQDGTLSFATAIVVNDNGGGDAGLAPSVNFVLSTPGGVKTYLQFAAWSDGNSYASATGYKGLGNVFTMTPVTSSYRDTAFAGGTTADSNPIIISAVVPEPGTFALAGLGAAAMLIFRRRK